MQSFLTCLYNLILYLGILFKFYLDDFVWSVADTLLRQFFDVAL